MLHKDADVVVIGCGNAALCAAISASQRGADVVVLESAPENESGGNTAFTAGAMRVAYEDRDQLLELLPELPAAEVARSDFGKYPEAQFFDDMARLSEYRADPDLVETLVKQSHSTLRWMTSQGVRFTPIYGRQAYLIDGQFKFWGGLTIETVGGGPGLLQVLKARATQLGVTIYHRSRAKALLTESGRVTGAIVDTESGEQRIEARSVILASGGFEANAAWRNQHLGPGWDLAKVRGSRYNVGDGIRMALAIGASPHGHWSGCHAVQWDRNAPEFGDLAVGDGFQKHSYPLGVLVNEEGRRFLDEGADFRNYTYAKYGRMVLQQPGQVAWQVFDAKTTDLMRDEYRIEQVTKVAANSLAELAQKMDGIDQEQFLRTIEEFNRSIDSNIPYNPNVLDGRSTTGIDPPKSNWANPIEEGPFTAYQVTCGITFTFGGLRVSEGAEVLNTAGEPIPHLFACGELVGGLFYFNYPGGAGLTAGSVFGRIAGANAACRATEAGKM